MPRCPNGTRKNKKTGNCDNKKAQDIPKIVGEGTYGCVHSPMLKCADGTRSRKNTVSKLMTTEHANREMDEYGMIKKIDKKNKYYLGVPHMCPVKIDESNIRAIKPCKLYNKQKQKISSPNHASKNPTIHVSNQAETADILKKMSLLLLKNGGEDLTIFVKNLSMYSDADRKTRVIQFWKKAIKLFEGVLFYQRHDVLHNDIKPNNIVYNASKNDVNFIDFGLSTYMSKTKYLYSTDKISSYRFFWSSPFEYSFLSNNSYTAMIKKTPEQKKMYVDSVMNEYRNKIDTSRNTFNAFTLFFSHIRLDSNFQKIYLDEYKTFIQDDIQNIPYRDFLEMSINTFDVFGLGIALFFVLNKTRVYNILSADTDKLLFNLFFNMTRPRLHLRYTIEVACKIFKVILHESKEFA